MSRLIGVAIAIPEPWSTELAAWRAKVGDPQADAIPPHVTLLPPTEVSQPARAEVEAHLGAVAAAHAPFELHLKGTGTFRPVSDVVFVALADGRHECARLERAVRAGPLLRTLPYPYHPHVTVAHDVPDDALQRAEDALADFDARFTVRGFMLYEHGTDAVWRPYRRFDFVTAGEPGN